MRLAQARFITACQQLLALGAVLAVLTPAAAVVSLDIVGAESAAPVVTHAIGGVAKQGALASATVPTAAVAPDVTEVPLTTESGDTSSLAGRTLTRRSASATQVTSRAQEVAGFGAVGVTWQQGEDVAEDAITVLVRTRTDSTWTDWQTIDYHDDHGPDAGSAEAAHARPGTDPVIVGDVDDVQVKATVDGVEEQQLPKDLSMAIIAPGQAEASAVEAPAATSQYDAEYDAESGAESGAEYDAEFEQNQGESMQLSAARTGTAARAASMPTIYTRAQWGADEKIRNKSALRYGSVSAGFVHHTVNANNYSEAEVPGIIRSIYAYHVKSRGWSDIGYNFLVDRFGRIWEGRFGGVDKNVVGAHTLGYNDYSFAMSAIGNFETTQPSQAMLQAYGALFGWKLAINGVNPASTAQKVGKKTFQAINGHRDAGSTACPGKYLYAQIPAIRQLAATGAPAPAPAVPTTVTITDPAPQSNLVGPSYPDLVVRRASDGRGMIMPTGGLSAFAKAQTVSRKGWQDRPEVLVSPDLTGDGVSDLVSMSKQGVLRIRPGRGNAKFRATSKTIKSTHGYTLLTAVGDLNGDGRNDLVARHKGRLMALYGAAKGGFSKRTLLRKGLGPYTQLIGSGDQNGDGLIDLMARDSKKRLWMLPGGNFGSRIAIAGPWTSYARLAGGADLNGDGRHDLLARTRKGKLYTFYSRGDLTFSPAIGPTANVRALRSLTAAGNLVGDAAPDLLGVKGKALVVVPNKGTYELGAAIDTGQSFVGADTLLNAGDWNGDGAGDVITRNTSGALLLYTGNGTGALAAPTQIATGFTGVSGLRAVGDVTGDGKPDLVGTPPAGGLAVYPGTGTGILPGSMVSGRTALTTSGLPADLSPYDWVIPVSDIKDKGSGDFVVRQKSSGILYLFAGTNSGSAPPRYLSSGAEVFDLGG